MVVLLSVRFWQSSQDWIRFLVEVHEDADGGCDLLSEVCAGWIDGCVCDRQGPFPSPFPEGSPTLPFWWSSCWHLGGMDEPWF